MMRHDYKNHLNSQKHKISKDYIIVCQTLSDNEPTIFQNIEFELNRSFSL